MVGHDYPEWDEERGECCYKTKERVMEKKKNVLNFLISGAMFLIPYLWWLNKREDALQEMKTIVAVVAYLWVILSYSLIPVAVEFVSIFGCAFLLLLRGYRLGHIYYHGLEIRGGEHISIAYSRKRKGRSIAGFVPPEREKERYSPFFYWHAATIAQGISVVMIALPMFLLSKDIPELAFGFLAYMVQILFLMSSGLSGELWLNKEMRARRKSTEWRKQVRYQAQIDELLYRKKRLRDTPEEWFVLPDGFEITDVYTEHMAEIGFMYLYENARYVEAEEYFEKHLKGKLRVLRRKYAVEEEYVYLGMLLHEDKEIAIQRFKEREDWMSDRKESSRVCYLFYRYVMEDEKMAEQYRVKFEQFLAGTSKEEIAEERRLVRLAEEKYAKRA